ncbi:MAG: hypothetical protein WA432_03180 [Candidatus Babeliaceae bacterium]
MKNGLSLLECMIYLMGSSLLIICLWELLLPYYTFTRRLQDNMHVNIELVVALDRFSKDMYNAPCRRSAWKLMVPHGLVWSGEHADYGWFLEDKRLVRYEGRYEQGKWHAAIKAPLLIGVDALHFEYCTRGSVIEGIMCTLTTSGTSLKKYVSLHNKRVLTCNFQ